MRHAADAAHSKPQAGEKSPATIIHHYHPNQMTKKEAIRQTRACVRKLTRCAGGYKNAVYDYSCSTWNEISPRSYHAARLNRSKQLINLARHFLWLEPIEYKGGKWTKYL
jgi:hypothetical protein